MRTFHAIALAMMVCLTALAAMFFIWREPIIFAMVIALSVPTFLFGMVSSILLWVEGEEPVEPMFPELPPEPHVPVRRVGDEAERDHAKIFNLKKLLGEGWRGEPAPRPPAVKLRRAAERFEQSVIALLPNGLMSRADQRRREEEAARLRDWTRVVRLDASDTHVRPMPDKDP